MQLIQEHYPDSVEELKNCDQWLARFCRRFKVSLRLKTHTAQKTPAEVEIILCKFDKHLLRVRKTGKCELADIANMDQTGSSSINDDSKTYEITNSKDVWCKSGQSGLDKRQCTVQRIAFEDSIPCIKPLLIFRGQGLRIKNSEKEQ